DPFAARRGRGTGAHSCLVLGRSADLSLDGEMREELRDFRLAHLPRIAFAVEQVESSHPRDVGLLGPWAVISTPDFLADEIAAPGLRHIGRPDLAHPDRQIRHGAIRPTGKNAVRIHLCTSLAAGAWRDHSAHSRWRQGRLREARAGSSTSSTPARN